MRVLHLITARGGSKGLPGKNTKILGDKALFLHSVEFAQNNMGADDVLCISTDDETLIEIAQNAGIKIHFKRPEHLASDTASSLDVIRHAIDYFQKNGETFDALMLLQPTSPIRTIEDYNNALSTFTGDVEMAVSVKQSKENPYFTLFEEAENGYLQKSKEGYFTRRQDCPAIYAYNGSIYLMDIESVMQKSLSEFTKIKKFVMPDERSVDIDTMADWVLVEYYFNGSAE